MFDKIAAYAAAHNIRLEGSDFASLKEADLAAVSNGGEVLKEGREDIIRWYQDGLCYYYYEIVHDNETQVEQDFGKYGVVRNNWYALTLGSVDGPGTPWYPDIDEPGPGDPTPRTRSTARAIWASRSRWLRGSSGKPGSGSDLRAECRVVNRRNMYARQHIGLLLAFVVPVLLAACEGIRDGREECGIYLEFIYDLNMEYADAFDPQVGTVDVFVFDDRGLYRFARHAGAGSSWTATGCSSAMGSVSAVTAC